MKSDTREDKQVDTNQLTYIIIKINYETKLILPIEKGLEFVKTWASAIQLKEPYNKPAEYAAVNAEFNLQFISAKNLAARKVAVMLEPTGDTT